MLTNIVNTNLCHHSPSDNFSYKIEITPFFFTVETSPIPNDLNGVPNFHNETNKEEKRTYHLIFRFCIINRYAHSNQVIYKKNLTQPDHKEWARKSKEETRKKKFKFVNFTKCVRFQSHKIAVIYEFGIFLLPWSYVTMVKLMLEQVIALPQLQNELEAVAFIDWLDGFTIPSIIKKPYEKWTIKWKPLLSSQIFYI